MEKEKFYKRKAQALETKKKIFKNADQLFKNHGIEKVSVDSIVEAAGVSKGAFYVHFESKDALIAAIAADYIEKLDLDYGSYLQSFPADTGTSEILISLVGKIAEIMANRIGYDLIKIVYEVQLTKTADMNLILSYNRDLYKMFSAVISKGVERGEFKTDISPDEITKHCLLAIRGITYEWCIRYPDFDLRNQTIEHFQILLAGIKKQ